MPVRLISMQVFGCVLRDCTTPSHARADVGVVPSCKLGTRRAKKGSVEDRGHDRELANLDDTGRRSEFDDLMDVERAPQARARSRSPVNILLVDDSPAKLLTYEVILAELQENLIKTSSAEEAFDVLLKNDVALVLTDVSMPEVDGFEFAKALRAHPRFEAMPIVFVTAIAHSDLDRLHGYTSGAVDYVTSPVVPELLRAKVKVFVDLYRRNRELATLKAELEARVAERTAELQAYTARLAESEQRYRALIDNANDIVATFDLEGIFTSVNPAVERILGYKPADLVGTRLNQFIPQEEIRLHDAMLRRKLEGEASTQYEMQALAKAGRRRVTLEVNSKLLFDAVGKPIGVHSIARDITERKEAEARQTVLIRELQHRTKNLLAVIQSIVTNTLANSRDLSSARDATVGRLHALARAQEFIATGSTAGVGLRDLVDAELAGFAARLRIDGAPLVVDGGFAQQFALVVHELATNAAKYGSLSTPAGRVLIAWEITQQNDEPMLRFSWLERDGPPVSAPTQRGFGSRLIAAASNGAPRIAYRESGLEFALDVPLWQVIGARKSD
jgi:PAS domain S-box-containing protein